MIEQYSIRLRRETLVTEKDIITAIEGFEGGYYQESYPGEYHVFQKLVDFPDEKVTLPGLNVELEYDSTLHGKTDFSTGNQKQHVIFTIGDRMFSIEKTVSEDDLDEYRLDSLTEVEPF